jgi:very-short-patch-repair endonuclease
MANADNLSDSLSRVRERAGVRVRSRQLRSESTDAEKLLWSRLRNRQMVGYKFRRQHPVAGYFADFACVEVQLIVELDGGQHGLSEERARDDRRGASLATEGFTVMRFWNHEVLTQTEAVLQAILNFLEGKNPHPDPLPRAGEGVNRPEAVSGSPHPNPLPQAGEGVKTR